MTVHFTPIQLDVATGDSNGVLVMHDDALVAVATQLSEFHGDVAGFWFVEAIFNHHIDAPREPFASLQALERWVTDSI